MVNNHIPNVTKVAKAVICCAEPVKVNVAIINPTNVHAKFKVSLIASTTHLPNFFIN